MDIGLITPYTKNAKKHDKKQVQQIANSIKEFNCVNCGKIWTDYISNDKNKRYCSVDCKSKFARVERSCKKCFRTFTICKTTLEQSNSSGNYCCRKCYVESMTTGLTRNKAGFRTISQRLRKTKPMCAICGTKNRIHIHHIEPYRYTKDNSLSNLIPLCISHHKIVECQTEKLLQISEQSTVFMMVKNILFDRQQHTNFVCV